MPHVVTWGYLHAREYGKSGIGGVAQAISSHSATTKRLPSLGGTACCIIPALCLPASLTEQSDTA